MTTTKQSTANPCAYFKGCSVCRTGPDKWPIFCWHHFQAHFLFENRFILAANCFNSFPEEQAHFLNNWGHSLGERPTRGIMRQKESRWIITWWRHQMETFSAVTGPLWGNSPVIGEFPSQKPVTRSFDVFFDLRLNRRLSKQSWDWWFETPSGSLWRHCNEKNCQKKSSHPMRGIRPSVGQWETALLEILKSYWAHCHAKVRFSLFPYGICIFLNQD